MSYRQSSRSMSSVFMLAAPIECNAPCTTIAENGTQCFALSGPAGLSRVWSEILLLFVGLSDEGGRVKYALLLIVTVLLGWEQVRQIDAHVLLRSNARDIKRGGFGFRAGRRSCLGSC